MADRLEDAGGFRPLNDPDDIRREGLGLVCGNATKTDKDFNHSH
jgi:hypothetical protein